MQSTILKYKEKIPSRPRTILDALAESTRQALVMMLAGRMKSHSEELSNSAKPINPSTLNHHFKALIGPVLVENHYRKTEVTRITHSTRSRNLEENS